MGQTEDHAERVAARQQQTDKRFQNRRTNWNKHGGVEKGMSGSLEKNSRKKKQKHSTRRKQTYVVELNNTNTNNTRKVSFKLITFVENTDIVAKCSKQQQHFKAISENAIKCFN